MYVFDTSALSSLIKNFYRKRFPTLWGYFDDLAAKGGVTSTREVRHELNRRTADDDFVREYRNIFTTPTPEEARFIMKIYEIRHFQQNIELQKMVAGGYNADAFVIAKAAVNNGTIVTLERERPNAARIPNICRHFGIACCDLEQFMEAEGWKF